MDRTVRDAGLSCWAWLSPCTHLLRPEQRGNRPRMEEKWFLIAIKTRKMGHMVNFVFDGELSAFKKNP
jgi:hypothetical protein